MSTKLMIYFDNTCLNAKKNDAPVGMPFVQSSACSRWPVVLVQYAAYR